MNVEEIEMEKIHELENIRLRLEKEDVHTLMTSIKQDGLLEPIGVSPINGKGSGYNIVYGHRRFRACKNLGWSSIPCVILDKIDLENHYIKNALENIERSELKESEIGRVFYLLMKQNKMEKSEIASRFGISNSRVNAALSSFSQIPEEYREDIKYFAGDTQNKKGKIPATTADKILTIAKTLKLNKEKIKILLDEAKKDRFTIKHLEIVGILLGQGWSVENAIDEAKEYHILHLRFAIKKKELAPLKKKYHLTFQSLITKIVRGDIKEKIDLAEYRF